jgi:membrane protease YdiL (CAAX protease family)
VKLYLLAIAAGMVSAIPNWLGWHDDTVIMRKWVNIMVAHYWLLLFCAITAGITEELICRVYLVPRLALLFKNNYMPVIVSAAIFSALHYRYFSLRETIFTFLIGVVFAAHYQKYRNIHVLILVHFMIDFFSFLVARYALEHHLKTFGMLNEVISFF